jgi:Tol biopolymer transport system component
MKTFKICLLWLFLIAGSLSAQNVNIVKRYKVNGNEVKGTCPVLSPAGDKLLFTSENQKGLWLYDLNTKELITICESEGAGYAPIFNADGTKIFYRKTIYQNKRKLDAIESFDLVKKQKIEMISPQRNLAHLQNYQNGFLVSTDRKLLKATFGKTKNNVPPYVCTEDLKLVVYANGKRTELNPTGENNARYIWVSLSPDNKKILFTVAGKGTYVSDLEGKITASLGYLNAPVWYNNDYVIGMQDKDDGHFITASKVLLVSLNGKIKMPLSLENEIAMYPSASSKGNKVAYNQLQGDIIIVELDVKP